MRRSATNQLLYDPRKEAEAIRLTVLAIDAKPIDPSRTNYFAIYWIEAGSGEFCADAAWHSFAAGSLLFFTPYQYIRIAPQTTVQGAVIQFHANSSASKHFMPNRGAQARCLVIHSGHQSLFSIDRRGGMRHAL